MKDIDDFEELPDEETEPVPGGGHEPDLPPGGGGGEPDVPPDDERTEAERAIDAKRRQLERSGRGLGSPLTGVEDAGHGGRVQTFERGRIYWHSATGIHEVHGGILQTYLERGGPDRNPKTGRRDLKFPTSDEGRALDGHTPLSRFETGSIYWVDGAGGVAIYGEIETQWRRMGAGQSRLGFPLSDPHERDGVDVVFFERGGLWTGPGSDGRCCPTGSTHAPSTGVRPSSTRTTRRRSPSRRRSSPTSPTRPFPTSRRRGGTAAGRRPERPERPGRPGA